MENERTIVFIEPEILTDKDDKQFVKERVARVGRIIFSRDVQFTLPMLQTLYPDESGSIWASIVEQLAGRVGYVMVVEGRSAIREVSELVGLRHDPGECAEHTIRFYFDNRDRRIESKMCGDGKMYHHKYIDCARNPKQALEWARAMLNGSFKFQ